MKLPRFINLSLGTALVLLIGNAALSYRDIQQLVENERSVRHTNAVIAKAEETLSTLKDAETGQRGFLLTGRDRYLAPYQTAVKTINQHLTDLKQLIVDNPQQQQRLEKLDQSIATKLDELQTTINTRRTQGFNAALRLVETDRGKQIMDDVRQQVAEFQAEERRLLNARSQQSSQTLSSSLLTFILANAVSLFLLGLVYYLIRRDQRLRQLSEAQLRKSEAQFRQIAETIRDVFWVSEADDQNNLYVSPAYEEIWGRKREDILDENLGWQSAIHPDDRDRIHRAYLEKASQGGYDEEYRILRPDGQERWIRDRGFPVKENGQVVRITGIAEDITERKQAEELMRRSEERFRSAIFNAPLPTMLHTEDGAILQVNRAWSAITGYSIAEMPTLADWLERAYGDRQDQVRADIARVFPLQRPTPMGEYAVTTHTGETRLWDIHAAPVGELFDGRRLVVVMAIDVTDRHQAEAEIRTLNRTLETKVAERTAELQTANAQLQDANFELEAFTYSVSHDLRAPLRTMQGFAQALIEDYSDHLDDIGQEYIRYVMEGAEQMDVLISDLLTYSRLSRLQIQLHPVELNSVIEEALRQLSAQIQEQHAHITVDRALPAVMAQRSTLLQVITNLISNAVKFAPPDVQPQVRIWAEEMSRDEFNERMIQPFPDSIAQTPNLVRLWIEDNGIGIAPEHQDRIFRVFERLHGIETYPGTGVGLAIVRKGIDRMGGQSGVVSHLGQGSRFWIVLPQAVLNQTAFDPE